MKPFEVNPGFDPGAACCVLFFAVIGPALVVIDTWRTERLRKEAERKFLERTARANLIDLPQVSNPTIKDH